MKILNLSDYKVNIWGGGVTREIMILPANSLLDNRDFDIRISSAVIESPESTCSNFDGYKRIILPLEGSITLITPTGKVRLTPTEPFTFDGSDKITSLNSVGAIDFNVIFKPEVNASVKIINNYHHIKSKKSCIAFAFEDIKINGEHIAKYSSAFLTEDAEVIGKAIIIVY